MEKAYVFKVASKSRKRSGVCIEIKGNQTLADFDSVIRGVFNHDTRDHLSEFFREKWPQGGFGEIRPDGKGGGARKRIEYLKLSEGDRLGYVYDFGDVIRHTVVLEKIIEPEEGIKYPRVIPGCGEKDEQE